MNRLHPWVEPKVLAPAPSLYLSLCLRACIVTPITPNLAPSPLTIARYEYVYLSITIMHSIYIYIERERERESLPSRSLLSLPAPSSRFPFFLARLYSPSPLPPSCCIHFRSCLATSMTLEVMVGMPSGLYFTRTASSSSLCLCVLKEGRRKSGRETAKEGWCEGEQGSENWNP